MKPTTKNRPVVKTEISSFRFREGSFKRLDVLRAQEPDVPTRGEMLNRLIERAKDPWM
jgi:hypothetical protein